MTAQNKDIVRRFVAAVSAHDLEALGALTTPALVNHAAIPEAQGSAGLQRIMTKLFEAMPDYRTTCEDLIAEGDRVVARVRVRGTQTGPFNMGKVSLPASGKEMTTEQIHVFRLADGKIVEHWGGRDDIGMMRQLGHLPFGAR